MINNRNAHPRPLLERLLKKLNFFVDLEILNLLDYSDDFEILDPTLKYMGASHNLLSMISWTFEQLSTFNFKDLFTRDEDCAKKLNEAFKQVLVTGKPVLAPCKYHVVTEVKPSPMSAGVYFKALAPVLDASGAIVAVIAIMKLTPTMQA